MDHNQTRMMRGRASAETHLLLRWRGSQVQALALLLLDRLPLQLVEQKQLLMHMLLLLVLLVL